MELISAHYLKKSGVVVIVVVAEKLMNEAQKEVDKRWSLYEQMAQMDYSLEAEKA